MSGQKYDHSSFAIKEYYLNGLIELPNDGDFTPWKNYHNGNEIKTILYYHKYQFVSVRQLTFGYRTIISPQFLEEKHEIHDFLRNRKKGFQLQLISVVDHQTTFGTPRSVYYYYYKNHMVLTSIH
jgi:hypothetical protein